MDIPALYAYYSACRVFPLKVTSLTYMSTSLSEVLSKKEVKLIGRKSFEEVYPLFPGFVMNTTLTPCQAAGT